jgi:hypothetical protein
MSVSDDDLLEAPDDQYAKVRNVVFTDVLAVHAAEKQYNRERSRADWWVGGIGAAIGVLGLPTATVEAMYAKPVRLYTEIDDASGVIHEAYGAKDAPDHFNDRVVRHYLSEYINLRTPPKRRLGCPDMHPVHPPCGNPANTP